MICDLCYKQRSPSKVEQLCWDVSQHSLSASLGYTDVDCCPAGSGPCCSQWFRGPILWDNCEQGNPRLPTDRHVLQESPSKGFPFLYKCRNTFAAKKWHTYVALTNFGYLWQNKGYGYLSFWPLGCHKKFYGDTMSVSNLTLEVVSNQYHHHLL